MKKPDFKPLLFVGESEMHKQVNAEVAQAIFDRWYVDNIGNAVIVYSHKAIHPLFENWNTDSAGETYQARLVDVKKIEEV